MDCLQRTFSPTSFDANPPSTQHDVVYTGPRILPVCWKKRNLRRLYTFYFLCASCDADDGLLVIILSHERGNNCGGESRSPCQTFIRKSLAFSHEQRVTTGTGNQLIDIFSGSQRVSAATFGGKYFFLRLLPP